MFLNDMQVKEIEFGDTEGSLEFNSSEKISNMFFKDVFEDELEEFIDGDLRYIYGLKGTGKTSMLKFLEDRSKHLKIDTMYISYKDFKEEADVIHEFREELQNSQDKDTYTLTFWRWYLLSLISKNFLLESKYDTSNLIYNSKVKFFRVISTLLDVISDISIGNDETNYSLSFGDKKFDVKWDGQTSSRIRDLEKSIKDKLDKKIIIFIDELEISKFSSTYDVDAVLVKNLIRATRKINNLNKNLHIVLAVRSEVVGSIAVAGDEINKELEDFGYEIEWHRRKFDIHHPLLSMYIQKIRYAMKKHIKNKCNNNQEMIKTLNKMNNSEIWYRWFPKKISGKDTPEFILQNTWLRPRDLSRLFRTMKKYSKKGANLFTQTSYEEAIKKVGEESWQEIEEELSSLYTENEVRNLISILEKMQILFTKEMFIQEAKKYNIDIETSSKILHDLYRISAIGNAYKSFNNNRFATTYRFAYRNDKSLYEEKAIYIHKAIQHALGLTDFNALLMIEHLSEENKQKFLSKEYIQPHEKILSNDSDMAFNLQDKLRDSDFRIKE